ncbi:MAG TPA: hypothetical protein ENL42_00280 [Thermoplasmatales archaeon]|nr:hypothetical protein [Thermoplasmatales archaeon]
MRSIIIGIDGAEPTLIQKWIDELPNLQKFQCFGKLESTLPPSSAPAWTSIVTGVKPSKHGIFDFFYFDGKSIKVISRHSRRMPAIWNLLSDIGKRSIVINVPVTYPPERINGVIVSGLLTPPGEKFFYPPDAAPFLNDYKLEHLVIDDVPIRLAAYYEAEKVKKILHEWTESRAKAAIRLMKNFPWDFAMVVFRATDLAQHFLWGDEGVFDIYRKVDEMIGKIMERFRANYFIVSDHGFYKIEKNVFINNLLYEKGYLAVRKKPSFLKAGKILSHLLHHFPRKFTHLPFMKKILFSAALKEGIIDFDNTTAFCLSSSSRAVICRKEAEKEIVKLLNGLRDGGKKPIKMKKMFEMGEWSYLVAELEKGYAIMDNINFEDIIERPTTFYFKGEHSKQGIFMAYGKDIKEWYGEAKAIDVVPTVLHSLELPIPSHVEGNVLDIFSRSTAAKRVEWGKFGISRKEKEKIRALAKSKLREK